MLFIGDQAADVDGLLRAGCEVSPFPPPDKDEMDAGDVWRWWFFKSMIAVEMHPRVVCDNNARLDRGLWYQALMKLADEREKLPLNGIVVTVAAQTLLGPADALKDTATRLRRLVDEAMEHLNVQMPVYFVVTGWTAGPMRRCAHVTAEAFRRRGQSFAEHEVVSAAAAGDRGILSDRGSPDPGHDRERRRSRAVGRGVSSSSSVRAGQGMRCSLASWLETILPAAHRGGEGCTSRGGRRRPSRGHSSRPVHPLSSQRQAVAGTASVATGEAGGAARGGDMGVRAIAYGCLGRRMKSHVLLAQDQQRVAEGADRTYSGDRRVTGEGTIESLEAAEGDTRRFGIPARQASRSEKQG